MLVVVKILNVMCTSAWDVAAGLLTVICFVSTAVYGLAKRP